MEAPASRPPRAHVGRIGLLPGVAGAVALGLIAGAVITAMGIAILTGGGPAPATGSGQRPSPAVRPIDPGTYHAGDLTAPAALGSFHRLTVNQPAQAEFLVTQKAALQQATGAPTIAAAYGTSRSLETLPVVLTASSGYVDAAQYLTGVSSSPVHTSTVGQDSCATYPGTAVVCARASKASGLTVVVEGTPRYLPSDHAAATLVDQGWKKLGG